MSTDLDADGYPTEEALQRIRTWDPADPKGLWTFIKAIWWMPDFGWHEEGDILYLATGGWSGNEDLIAALMDNHIVWTLSWISCRRGGGFVFDMSGQYRVSAERCKACGRLNP